MGKLNFFLLVSESPDEIDFSGYSHCSIHISYHISYFPQLGSRLGKLPVKNNLKDEKIGFGD